MSGENTGATLNRYIMAWADAQLDEPARDLQWAAKHLAVATYTDPQWPMVEDAMRRMASGNSIDGILARQREAMVGIYDGLRLERRLYFPDSPSAEGPSEAEMEDAESDLRNRLPEIAERLSEVEQAVDKITADPVKRGAIKRVSEIIKKTDVARLSPFGLLIVLWWLFVLTPQKDADLNVAVLALWYTIARDSWRKD